tara:strand:- start:64 stop:318 length:255 start_codon:yes stop_codon:yes gene_type:complete
VYDHSHNEAGEDEDEKKRSFSTEVHLEAAQLVVEQGYTVKAACDAMGVGKTTMEYCVRIPRFEQTHMASISEIVSRYSAVCEIY